jgi:hypothetical protein
MNHGSQSDIWIDLDCRLQSDQQYYWSVLWSEHWPFSSHNDSTFEVVICALLGYCPNYGIAIVKWPNLNILLTFAYFTHHLIAADRLSLLLEVLVHQPGQFCWSLTFQKLVNDQQSTDLNCQLLLLHAAESSIHVLIKWNTAICKNSHTTCAVCKKTAVKQTQQWCIIVKLVASLKLLITLVCNHVIIYVLSQDRPIILAINFSTPFLQSEVSTR